MNKIDIDRDKLTKIVAVSVLLVAVVFSYLYFFWLPVSKKISEIRDKVSKIEAEIKKARDITSKYPNLEKKLSELEAQKADVEKKLPRDKNMPDLMKTIKKIADKYSVSINSISPSTAVKEQYFFRITYSISVSGSYHDIGSFLSEISIQERILNVENVLITGGAVSNVNFILVSYQYDDGKK